ncbi:MAG TPA: LysR substrate-binding domain-containing protein [Xanthobacteraceae bacterium]|jgi:aminoethylphosphonate catabolism LysR family transcriptional regulator|nr:LysR substrate-binding domain-containing protein [Xanthobacteraceae bacterium]
MSLVTQLRAFHLVADAGSFSLAARTAGLSQPTLSAQVRALEASYAVDLFDRRGRGVRMTPTGQSLFALTTRLIAAEEEARALLTGGRALTRGHLRVSADSAYHVIPILAELKRLHAGVTFTLKIDNSAAVLDHLTEHGADIAVMAKMTSDPRIFSMKLREDRLIVFVPQGHAWARRRQIRISELAGRDIVVRERGSITREVFEARLAQAGVVSGSLIEVQTREGVREAVAAGFGVGVVFDSEFGTEARFHAIEVSDSDLTVGEYVACLQERRRLPLVRAFLDVARDLATEKS